MTRPAAPVIALGTGAVALGVASLATLVWCAWLLVSSDLPAGAAVAAWVLWVVAVAAASTVAAYLRELLRYRPDVRAGASWRPLPGLALLWLAGLAAVVAFPFMLPRGGAAALTGPHGGARASQAPAGTPGEPSAQVSATGSRIPKAAPTTVTGIPDAPSAGDASGAVGTLPAPTQGKQVGADRTSPTTATPSPARPVSAAFPTPSSTPLLGVTLPPRPGKRLGTLLPHPTKR